MLVPLMLLVATTPTACGIETVHEPRTFHDSFQVATTPTACGIETGADREGNEIIQPTVATTPTACGIETKLHLLPFL